MDKIIKAFVKLLDGCDERDIMMMSGCDDTEAKDIYDAYVEACGMFDNLNSSRLNNGRDDILYDGWCKP